MNLYDRTLREHLGNHPRPCGLTKSQWNTPIFTHLWRQNPVMIFYALHNNSNGLYVTPYVFKFQP